MSRVASRRRVVGLENKSEPFPLSMHATYVQMLELLRVYFNRMHFTRDTK